MKRWLPHIGIALGLTIAVYALFFAESEEDRIRGVLDRLEAAVRISEGSTNPVLRLANVKSEFSEIFDKNVRIAIPELTDVTDGRKELVTLATQAPQAYARATVDLDGLSIRLDEAKTTSIAYGQATLEGALHSGEQRLDARTVSIRLDKIEGDWVIVEIAASTSLEDPGGP